MGGSTITRICSVRSRIGQTPAEHAWRTRRRRRATSSTVRKVKKPAPMAMRPGRWLGVLQHVVELVVAHRQPVDPGPEEQRREDQPRQDDGGPEDGRQQEPADLDVPAGEHAHGALQPAHVPVGLGGRRGVARPVGPVEPHGIDLQQRAEGREHAGAAGGSSRWCAARRRAPSACRPWCGRCGRGPGTRCGAAATAGRGARRAARRSRPAAGRCGPGRCAR